MSIRGELGDFPAWRTPGTSKTWVIAVHGRNANASETLRFLPVFHSLGIPVLAISYRNDEGAPASEDGKFHLGATEWREVAAAVPGWLASMGKFVVERRTGISLDDVDHVRQAKEFRQPILLFVDDDDTSVPVEPSLRFAELRPDLVTLVRTKGGGHVGSWNVDQARYERALRDFLTASAASS
ncbi:alpha/beta hydrolase [Nonomuraea angiospora]|uniref:alpha/beta hydrolase n=1 Tax=Nonomuraea angiospora TaxID=46172 RepID=UPI003408F47C